MKSIRLSALALLLASTSMLGASPVLARDATDGKSESLAVEKVICQQLYVHKPAADVAFKPGVDVEGKPVAPADLPPLAAPVVDDEAEFFEVPLTVDLAQRLSQPVPDGVKLEGVIGNLRLYKDGRITSNGQDLLPQASTMCGVPLQKVEAPIVEDKPTAPVEEDTVVRKEEPVAGATALSSTINPAPKSKKLKLAKKTANFSGRLNQ